MVDTGYLLHLIGGEEGFQRVLQEQGGGCAICGALPVPGERSFHIDHDHRTGMVRGVLCRRCNPGLGLFGDDDDSLEAAAAYVRHWREEHAAGRAPKPDTSGPRRRADLPASAQPRRSTLPEAWTPELVLPRNPSKAYLSAVAKLRAEGIASADVAPIRPGRAH